MDSAIFEQCVQNLGIIIENCQTHPLIENLKAVITTKCYTKKPTNGSWGKTSIKNSMVVKRQLRLTDVGNLSELKPRGFVGENFDMNDCADVNFDISVAKPSSLIDREVLAAVCNIEEQDDTEYEEMTLTVRCCKCSWLNWKIVDADGEEQQKWLLQMAQKFCRILLQANKWKHISDFFEKL